MLLVHFFSKNHCTYIAHNKFRGDPNDDAVTAVTDVAEINNTYNDCTPKFIFKKSSTTAVVKALKIKIIPIIMFYCNE